MTKINANGIYDIPMEEYHSDNCEGFSVSSSGLRTVINECPAEFWAFSYMNPDAFPPKDNTPYIFGRAAHCLLMGGEDWDSNYIVRPAKIADAPKKPTDPQPKPTNWNGNRTVCRNWLKAHEHLTVVTSEQRIDIECMARVLEKHPLAPTLLDGEIEQSLIWKDEETGLWLKARPDVIPRFDRTVNDYKSTSSRCHIYQLTRDVFKYGYHMQAALVGEGLTVLRGDDDPYNFILTFQQSAAPYHVIPVEISAEAIEAGRIQNRRALRIIADCIDKGHWPGYADGIPIAPAPEGLETWGYQHG